MANVWTKSLFTAKAACDTGTETARPPTTADHGLALAPLRGFGVYVESQGGGNMTAGFLRGYLRNPVTTNWARCPDIDLAVSAVPKQGFIGFSVPSPVGDVSFLPDGLGVAVDVHLIGAPRGQ